MLIKHQNLDFDLPVNFPALYILLGTDSFISNRVAKTIKSAWQQHNNHECDETIINIETTDHWSNLLEEAMSYSLFSQAMFIDVRYEKKTIDNQAQFFFKQYLHNSNPQNLILFRAPNLSTKSIQTIINDKQAIVIQSKCPDRHAILSWIRSELSQQNIHYEQAIPTVIEQYTRGNLTACSQVIEKIKLLHTQGEEFTLQKLQQHLFDQSDYQLYELSDACLLGQSEQALLILRHAINNRTEFTLILWVLMQEIRYLIRLLELLNQKTNFAMAIKQLKIWPQRAKLYQSALKNHSLNGLYLLLKIGFSLDVAIKSAHTPQTQRNLELLVIALSTGKQVGTFE